MKLRIALSVRVLVVVAPLLLGVAASACGGSAQTNASSASGSSASVSNAPPAVAEIPQSVFVVPTVPKEGKDPFFPRSMRVYVTIPIPVPTNQVPVIGDLKITGISGSEDRPLVIINQETFGVGDTLNVVTGGRSVSLHCLEIDLSARSAKVQVAGQTRVLFFQKPGN